MENSNRYVLGTSLLAALLVVSGVFFLNRLMGTSRQTVSEELSYNMPRPKSALYNFFFGLEGREVRRTEIDPFKDKVASTSAGAGSVRKPETAKEIAAKAAKAAKDSQAAANAANLKAQQAKAQAAARKPQVKVTVIPKDVQKNSTSADGANRSEQSLPPAFVGSPTKSTSTDVATDTAANRMSPSQWRALIVGQPTKENIAKLIAAFNEKEVDSGTLYLIMNDLVQSSNSETQEGGLTIAQQVPSLKSFTVISTNYEKLDGSVKKDADKYFMSYMESSRLPILAMALQSDDNAIVHRAAQIMVAGLETAKNPTPVDSQVRPGRGTATATSTKSVFARFIPLFQNLEKNPDSSISGLAQNALGRLQALANT